MTRYKSSRRYNGRVVCWYNYDCGKKDGDIFAMVDNFCEPIIITITEAQDNILAYAEDCALLFNTDPGKVSIPRLDLDFHLENVIARLPTSPAQMGFLFRTKIDCLEFKRDSERG